MRTFGLTLVVAALLFVPTTGRASPVNDGNDPQAVQQSAAATPLPATEPTAAMRQDANKAVSATQADAAAFPERRTGFHTLFRDLRADFTHVPSRDSLLIALVGGGGALAVHPVDDTFNARLGGTSFFNAGDRLGNTFTIMGATFATYGVGLATGHNRVTHVAMDLVRAQVVSEVMVQSLKLGVRRQRPDASAGLSFPSGHTAVMFAAATVLQQHHGWLWALPAYGLASYVAASRLHDNVHYLSDVVFGAAVGTIAGRTVTRHGRSNFAMMPMLVPGGAGFVVVR